MPQADRCIGTNYANDSRWRTKIYLLLYVICNGAERLGSCLWKSRSSRELNLKEACALTRERSSLLPRPFPFCRSGTSRVAEPRVTRDQILNIFTYIYVSMIIALVLYIKKIPKKRATYQNSKRLCVIQYNTIRYNNLTKKTLTYAICKGAW